MKNNISDIIYKQKNQKNNNIDLNKLFENKIDKKYVKYNLPDFFVLNQLITKRNMLKPTLLIIDEDTLSMSTIANMLRMRGYKVFTISNINEGLKFYNCAKNKINFVMLNLQFSNCIDYRLTIPGLLSINNQVKIIGISENLTNDDLIPYFKNIMYGFLAKPLLIRELVKLINNDNKELLN